MYAKTNDETDFRVGYFKKDVSLCLLSKTETFTTRNNSRISPRYFAVNLSWGQPKM